MNLNEEIIRIQEVMGLSHNDLLLEASKKEILVDKVGFSEKNAEQLFSIAGPLSVWLGNNFMRHMIPLLQERRPELSKKEIVDLINNNVMSFHTGHFNSIMDWIRVGLNGNLGDNKNLSYLELKDKAKEWHDSLEIGDAAINYVEKNDILLDYRDENGEGFYWVDLETNDSNEECQRMGHCGRTNSGNTLYSLRETRKLNKDYTINRSHLTAALGKEDNVIYQLKGSKNSKPKEIYHPFIIDLILNGDIKGFGYEYDSKNDFNVSDLSDLEFHQLYLQKPELFKNIRARKRLESLGIIPKMETKFKTKIEPYALRHYIDGDYIYSESSNKSGGKETTTFFEKVLSGDVWGMLYGYFEDWEGPLEYYVDAKNDLKIREILKDKAGDKYDPEMSTKELIDEFDTDSDITAAIGIAHNDAASDAYYDYVLYLIKSAFEEYGANVISINDEGVELELDFEKIIEWFALSDEELEEYAQNCGGEIEEDADYRCIFSEVAGSGHFYRPSASPDKRYQPDIDEANFNSILSNILDEI
jgi:hypothetical protein